MKVIALLNQLMRPHYYFNFIYFVKLLNSPASKKPSCSSWILSPAVHIFLWIWPHQIAKWPWGWNFNIPLKCAYLIDRGSFGRKSSMYAKHFSLYHCCKWQVVECIIEIIPHIMIAIFLRDLVVEAISECYVAWLMIASQKNYHLRIFYFVEE